MHHHFQLCVMNYLKYPVYCKVCESVLIFGGDDEHQYFHLKESRNFRLICAKSWRLG